MILELIILIFIKYNMIKIKREPDDFETDIKVEELVNDLEDHQTKSL